MQETRARVLAMPVELWGGALRRILLRFDGPRRVWLLAMAMATGAFLIYATVIGSYPDVTTGFKPPLLALAVGFAVGEMAVVHLQFRRDAHSFSLSEIPLVIGLFFFTPGELLLAQLIGSGAALALHRRQSPLKLCFNLAQFALGATVAIAIFHAIIGPTADPLGPAGWLATFAAMFAADAIGACMVVLAISLSEGRPPHVPQLLGSGQVFMFANASLALVAVNVLWHRAEASWLLLVLAAMLYVAYRAYGSLRQKHESLELLYESTRVVQKALNVEPLFEGLMAQAREMFRAESAEILLFADGDEPARRTSLGPGDVHAPLTGVTLVPTEGVWARVVAEARALLLPRPIEPERLRQYFASNGVRDAMVAPLRGDDRIVGTMMVANRLGDVATFTVDDLQLFETLANHASVSLQNGRLVDRLRRQAATNEYQALHDALTDLPNRTLFHQGLRAALDESAAHGGPGPAVMILDLDRFKEVNDTLGHHNGDQLLIELSGRLRKLLRPTDMIARLSGDEFALLLPASGREQAVARADSILRALEQPFTVQELSLEVGASIGIALAPEHGDDADTLIQRADVAMYLAKESQAGSEVYSAERDQYSPTRLALVGEMRRAIEQREIVVYYQPKAEAQSGRITGAEALVRWRHPRHGLLTPDVFVPLAEHTGLIRPLTLYVLEAATRQCAAWRAAGHAMSIAVNLSARNLLDPELCDDIARILHRAGLPPSALELELTESTIMGDVARTEGTLLRLHEMGIEISIDDFGTGYSSLSYLKRLPVSEIKIDKSFVLGMESGEDNDEMIVRSTIDLGHNLGMRIVAEGVETAETWERLARLGCDIVQGYFLGRPVPAAQLTERLRLGDPVRRALAGVEVDAPPAARSTPTRRAPRGLNRPTRPTRKLPPMRIGAPH